MHQSTQKQKVRRNSRLRPLGSRFDRGVGGEDCDYGGQDEAQEKPQPGEDAAEVVADGGEDDVGGIAGAALEVAAAKVTF